MTPKAVVIGSGPSGFYAAEALLKQNWIVDMLECLPVPFGLVRYGVAPDHPKLKQPVRVYERIASLPGFSFYGNVRAGMDVGIEELRQAYHAVVIACGADSDRRLGIPGEDLQGCHPATDFVGWYNGHPAHRDRAFDLSHEVAVIVGQGNVAADLCRILSKRADDLRRTDIAGHALDALAESRIREIHIVGRRGPVQAKFTPEELQELGELHGVDPVIEASALDVGPVCATELEDRMNRAAQRNMALFRSFAARAGMRTATRKIHFRFLLGPQAILGTERVGGVRFECMALQGAAFGQTAAGTGATVDIPCGLVLRSVGYRGTRLPGVPFDERRGVIPNEGGRVLTDAGPIPGLYVTGWIKRGPTGIIGTNRADSLATVEAIAQDVARGSVQDKPGAHALAALLRARAVRCVDYPAWQRIDAAEIGRGVALGKPREKLTRVEEMLAAATEAVG